MTEEKTWPPLRDPAAPFALQLEWLANRYNPGYFLGGTIRPELRIAALGRRARRVAGTLAFVSGAGTLALLAVMLAVFRLPPDPWSLGLGVLEVLAGLKFLKAAALQTRSVWSAEPTEGRQVRRAAGVAVLGGALVAVLSGVALLGAVAATALAQGNAGLGGAIAVAAAIVALRRWATRHTGE